MAKAVKPKFRIPRRRLRRLGAWAVGLAAFGVLAGFVRSEHRAKACRRLDVRITDGTGYGFVTPADVQAMLAGSRKRPVGKKLSDINMAVLEKLICNNSFVAGAEVFSTVDGTLHIEVRQRRPVIRIINLDEEHFYVDETGAYMPASSQYTADVPVASGFISGRYADRNVHRGPQGSRELAGQLYALGLFLAGDPFWNAMIEQVYVDERQQLELVPRLGRHTVLLGAADNLREKLDKLKTFYREGLNRAGWDAYSQLNLVYDRQVVCTP
jgi:cell division protein FtsQ